MTQQTRSALLYAALDAAGRGWPVFPLRPGDKPPALHGETRCPRTGDCAGGHRKFEQRATTNPERIERCWATGAYNVGIATGPAGLLVVDLDLLKPTDSPDTPDGATSFLALCERAGQPVPRTRRIETPSGGEHLYFTTPKGVRLPSSTGRLAPKIDTRAWGGYVVAPGSRTPHGPYTVAVDSPVANLPEWLQSLSEAPQGTTVGPTLRTPARASAVARAAFEREQAAVATATEGDRERTLFEAARKMGRFVAWGDLDRSEVERAFQWGAESTGLPSYQCRSTLRSALNWSIAHCKPREHA
ncbi:bifunctional DNA primase/polymerase [Streptomyces sp. NBC_01198]|uniref:bifunctional DNA primase/polymerase n=1 Tax=Streptomyces sp. NBC_01198 TaxID=2903769 RepID=UPI002E15DA7B|nr:bifunctional DNA primase/polymerase [Streptomyces sp. NBC_01198]